MRLLKYVIGMIAIIFQICFIGESSVNAQGTVHVHNFVREELYYKYNEQRTHKYLATNYCGGVYIYKPCNYVVEVGVFKSLCAYCDVESNHTFKRDIRSYGHSCP